MSFSFASPSKELSNAISHANKNDVIVIAAVGNDGQKTTVYPAGYSDRVMGVASTAANDVRSSFSNYGSMVFVGAPGEGIVTTYPWDLRAVWGTSFSTPFVAGTAALLLDVNSTASETEASDAIAHAKLMSSDLGNGRLDVVSGGRRVATRARHEVVMMLDETAKSVRQLTLRVKELEAHSARTRAALICAFNQMLDLKDLNTGCHSTRLAEWGVRVTRDLGADESCLHDIETAALLHDIGKVGIPDAILHKAGKLDEDEWTLMKKHPEYGWAIVRLLPDFERATCSSSITMSDGMAAAIRRDSKGTKSLRRRASSQSSMRSTR